jgi:uncharacterized Fe-S cluster protein YjdI
MSKEHRYINGEVTIVWKQDRCTHSARCWKGLGAVFQPGQRPWIKPDGASSARILEQVRQCPSGALTIAEDAPAEAPAGATVVEVLTDGPLMVKGGCQVLHADGRTEVRTEHTAFCRCGRSGNKPFCDGSHRKAS